MFNELILEMAFFLLLSCRAGAQCINRYTLYTCNWLHLSLSIAVHQLGEQVFCIAGVRQTDKPNENKREGE